jgi:hypothetical protein
MLCMKSGRIIVLMLGLILSLQICTCQITEYSSYDIDSSYLNGIINIEKDNGYLYCLRTGNIHNKPSVLKLNGDGSIIWHKYINSTCMTTAHCMTMASNGDLIVYGWCTVGTSGGNLIRMDQDGNLVWSKTINSAPGSQFHAIENTNDNGIILVGSGCIGNNIVLMIDSLGTIVYQKEHQDINRLGGTAMQVLNTGDEFIVAGVFGEDTSNNNALFLMSLDQNGSFNWIQEYSIVEYINPEALIQTSNGNLVVTGILMDGSISHGFVFCADSLGNHLWDKNYGPNSITLGLTTYGLVQTNTQIILGGALQYPSPISNQVLLFGIDSVGDPMWMYTTGNINNGGNGFDGAGFMLQGDSSDYLITGLCDHTSLWHMNGDQGLCNYVVDSILSTDLNINSTPSSISVLDQAFNTDNITTTIGMYPAFETTLCATFGIEENQFKNGMSIYPNPTDGLTKIEFTQLLHLNTEIQIVDGFGRVIKSLQMENNHSEYLTIDVSEWDPGIYFVVVNSNHGSLSNKLVVE